MIGSKPIGDPLLNAYDYLLERALKRRAERRGQSGNGRRCPVCGQLGEFERGVWRCECHRGGSGDRD